MTLPLRLTCFFVILVLQLVVNQTPAKVGRKETTPFLKQIQLTCLIVIAALGGASLFWLYYHLVGINGSNEVVMLPFLVGLMSFLISGVILMFTKKKIGTTLQSCLVILPLILNLALVPVDQIDRSSDFWYTYLLSLLFFLVVSMFSAGILERLKIAPIPRLLQGVPIQFTVLMLIFLSLSFFKGVFFGELF